MRGLPLCEEIISHLTQNIFIKDTDSVYLYCNPAYAELLGVAPEEIVGKNDEAFFPEGLAAKYREDDRRVLRENRIIDINEQLVIDGKTRVVRTVKQPLRSQGKVIGVLGSFWDITHVYEREQELRELKRGLIKAQELAHIGHWELNLRQNSLYWSDEVYRIFGLKPQSLNPTYETFLEHVHPDDLERVNRAYNDSVARKSDYEIVHRVLRTDGTVRFVEERGTHEFDEMGEVVRSIGTVHDISGRREAEEGLQLAAKVVDNTTNGVLITDANQRIIYINDSMRRISGYSMEEMTGQMPNVLKSGWHDGAYYEKMWKSIEEQGHWQGEIRDRKKDGELYVANLSIFVLKNDLDQITNYIAITEDVTEKKEREELIHNLAYYDSLTELPNRVLFKQMFEQNLRKCKRDGGRCALLFFDLDNFKNINDTLGHMVGDNLLKAVGSRLQKLLRGGDTLCRIGGDEFTVIVESYNDPVEIAHLAERINKGLHLPFEVDQHELFIGGSIGISVYPDDGDDFNTLVKAADTAMYHAKETSKGSYKFYTHELNQVTTERLIIENELRHATERNEMFLVYQPKIDLRSGAVYGLEALLRWSHPVMGAIPPAKFIPVAEETGQINQIGMWVTMRAMGDLYRLQEDGYEDLVMSVNVSNIQFSQENFVAMMFGAVINTGIEMERFELEITESTLMENIDVMMEKLDQLHQHGIRLSIDDFGTGYSSLSYLKKLPVQTLKIDRSFVDEIVNDPDDRSITSSIISLGQNMGMEVVAEGTETAEQIEVLQELGCHRVQGYYYAEPMPYIELRRWLGAYRQQTEEGTP